MKYYNIWGREAESGLVVVKDAIEKVYGKGYKGPFEVTISVKSEDAGGMEMRLIRYHPFHWEVEPDAGGHGE